MRNGRVRSAAHRTQRRRWLVALAASVALAGQTAAPAAADSVAFIAEHNVWVANADGSGRHQVTRDGTAQAPYTSPSQADDGTVVALRQAVGERTRIYRMTQNGALLNPPVDTPAPGTGALDAKVSPDGSLVAYWFVTGVNPGCLFCISAHSQVLISRADRFTGAGEVGTPNTGGYPSWVSRDTLVMGSGSASQWYYRLGMPEAASWFADSDFGGAFVTLLDAEASPRGDRLAVVRGDRRESILLLKLNGAPPAKPSLANAQCALYIGNTFHDPTWSSDGRLLAWQEAGGVAVTSLPENLSDCGAYGAPELRFPGASAPDFSPAAINPGPPAPCGHPGNPVCEPEPPNPPDPCSNPAGCAPPVVDVTRTALTKDLRALIKRETTALRKRGLRALRRSGRHKLAFRAPAAGTLTITLKVRGSKTVLMHKRVTYRRAERRSLTLKLSRKHARQLRDVRRLRVALTARFVTTKGMSVRAQCRVDLRP